MPPVLRSLTTPLATGSPDATAPSTPAAPAASLSVVPARPEPAPVDGPTAEPARRTRTGLVYFAHLARLSLDEACLDDDARDHLRRDLAVLVAESSRTPLRPRLLHALLDAVLDELVPALPGPARAELVEARPTFTPASDSAS